MASQITNYQCPACTGPLHFAGESGRLECEYCGSSFSVEEIEALYREKEEAAVQAGAEAAETEQEAEEAADESSAEGQWENGGENWDAEAEGFKAYNCPSCGAELIMDEHTAATSCPYCGNPSIIPGQFSDMLRPDYILPFKMDKEAAKEALKKYYKGKKFLPKAFAAENHIEELKGVYVPFWLFDGQADADISGSATRIFTHTSGDYRITTTEFFRVRRAGTVNFEKVPVDASSKMPDSHMDAIEPFNYAELKEFSTAYLPGYMADKYDQDVEKCSERADMRAGNTAVEMLRSSVRGYASFNVESRRVNIRRGNVKYALLPVWMLSTRWNGGNYLFAMNGQTGKLIGDLPISRGKVAAWFAGIALPLMAVLSIFMF